MTNLFKQKLDEAKNKIKLFGLDYDGTIHGEGFDQIAAGDLIKKIIQADKYAAIITARAATAVKVLYPMLSEFYQNCEGLSSFIGGGNGTILYEVNKNGLEKIYSHGMNLQETKRNLEVYQEIYKELGIAPADLNIKGIETFQDFLKQDWTGYVPPEFIDLCRSAEGQYFTEEAKTTFVLPIDESLHREIVNKVQDLLGKEYSVKAGDAKFCHITKALDEDSKKTAIKTILERLNLKEDEIAAFGDMPLGNDQGLLSFPYSFTNSKDFAKIKDNLVLAPFVLDYPDLSPIGQVYEAINLLLSE